MSSIRFSRTILLATLAASLMLLLPATASARVVVGFGFPVYGGYWGGPYGYPYGPYGYGPYGYPGGYGGRPIGEVRIKSPEPDAEIYINGSFAGRAHDVKRIYLAAGSYKIEQRIGTDVQKQRIYVTAYRKLIIEFGKVGTPSRPDMQPPPGPGYGPGPGPENGPPQGNGPAPGYGPGPGNGPPPSGNGY
jgi:hypothetical protein